MKFSKFGRTTLALVVSLATGFGVTSCSTDHTVGYFYVTGSQYNQISGFRIDSNLGHLTAVQDSPYASGGVNPVKAVVANSGRFLYVLNAGCGGTSQIACPANTASDASGGNIALFTIGGAGSLNFQTTYTSQGNRPVSMQTDSSGSHLFILDSTVPDPTTCVGYVPGNPATICGDITSFNIDPDSGRLTLITNTQVRTASGTALTYFPVGSAPINLAVFTSYIYTIEGGSGSASDPNQAVFVYSNSGGQLTLTQNTPIPTGAEDLSYIYASSKYVYLIDAGQSVNPAGLILPYTVGTNGALQSIAGGEVFNVGTVASPQAMIVDHQNLFLYVVNRGPNLTNTSSASSVSGYTIDVNGRLASITGGASGNSVVFGSSSDPQCILEDPSNQYLYTAGFADSMVTGAIINSHTGVLTTLRQRTTFPAVGQPTWCVASGTLF